MSADLLARLIEAGTPAALVAEVAMLAAEVARVDQRVSEAVAASREPTAGAIRTRRWRERHAPSQSVTRDAGDAHVTESVTEPPTLDKEIPPRPPKEINPTPVVIPAPREELGFSVRLNAVVAAWLGVMTVLAAQRRKRWKNMPPPSGVSDEQWRGFIEHRKAMRKSLTDRAYDLLVTKLAKHADDEWPPGRIVDHMVERQWLSFEPAWLENSTERRNGKRPHNHNQQGNQHPGGRSCAASDFVFGGDGLH